MAILDHPTSAELLLWQSGELSPERAEELRCHLAECRECQDKVAELESLYGEIASTRREAAQNRFHRAFLERQRPFWRKLHITPRWTVATASVVIAALLLVTFTEYTPSARAEVLLSRAVKEEEMEPEHAHLLTIQSSGMNCNVIVRHSAAMVSASDSNESFCGQLTANLHGAGWNWNDLLSARSFKQWRDSLPAKKDAIHKLPDATEVTTTTNDGRLHRATLRLRSTDYRAMQARFVFASTAGAEQPEFEVTESEEVPQEIAKDEPAPHPATPRPEPPPASLPVVDPMDTMEADVRLSLHRLGADENVLLAVNRKPDAVQVTGIVPATQAASITSSLAGLPHVETRFGSEDNSQSSTGWQNFHGDTLPLAYEQINALYANDPQGRQKFINDLDAITLRLAGEARTRDGLLSLANQLQQNGDGPQLHTAAAEIQSNMSANLAALTSALKPIIGPANPQVGRLSYTQATQLYTLVHELVSANQSSNQLGLDETAAQIKRLISGR